MAGTRRLSRLVESTSARLDLPPGPLVVALSGGADSAALAFLCASDDRALRALHINHGLAHSALMEQAARTVAEQLDIDLDVRTVTLDGKGASLEGRARSARYHAFAEATDPDEGLLTAHTVEDNAETVLFNLIRGTGARGLAGIPAFRPPNIWRPALAVSRSETREIAALAGLDFAEDPMNEDPALTRNLIRRQLIPYLEELNSRLVPTLARSAASLSRDVAFLESQARKAPVEYRRAAASCPVGVLLALPRPVADRVLMDMVAHVIGAGEITAARLERVWSVVRSDSAAQEISSGVTVVRRGPALVVSVAAQAPEDRGTILLTEGVHRVAGIELHVALRQGPCQVMPLSKWAAVFPPDTRLEADERGTVSANGAPAWFPGEQRLPVAWYEPGTLGYLTVLAREDI